VRGNKKTPISIDIEQVVILVCQIGQSERYEKPNFIALEMIWSHISIQIDASSGIYKLID
jgi:hypothetical protein